MGVEMKSTFINYAVFIAFIPVVYPWLPKQNPKPLPVCRSKECRRRGELYAAHMNTKTHPCTDFYEYACGSWADVHPMSYHLEMHVQDLMNEEVLVEMRKLLEAPAMSGEPKLYQKAKEAYQFCVDKPYMPRVSMKRINKHITKIRSLTKESPWFAHDEYLRLTGQSPFFIYSVLVDENNDYRPVIQFQEPVSAYGSIVHSVRWTVNETESYKQFLMSIYRNLAAINDQLFLEKVAASNIQHLITFRTRLDQIIENQAVHKKDKFALITVNQLETWYNGLLQHSARSRINWRNIVSILYSNTLHTVIETKGIVSLQRKSYFQDLANLLRDTPLDTIERHIEMFFVERHLIYTDKMINQLKETFVHTDAFVGYQFRDVPRWIACIEDHDMQHTIGMMYVDYNFHNKNVKPIRELILNLKNVLQDYVRESPDTSQTMKSSMAKQISSLTSVIGYPRWYFESDENIKSKKDAAFLANAKYNLRHNRIYISAAFIRSPMFEEVLPSVVNVGSMGTSIAHELNHIFGDCGYYPTNKMRIPWWTSEGRKQCEKKKQCFVDEYRRYALFILEKILDKDKINRMHTFVEDVADVMGLKIAYRYFFETLKGAERKCEVLPYFEQFTCEQMFFIAFANTMCGRQNLKLLTKKYQTMRHNVRRIRVNGAVMHNDNFSAAFDCPTGALMNPERKCDLWT